MQDYINYINGDWEKASKSKVPLNDAGFLLGDGLFETVRFENRKLFQPEKHLNRMHTSLKHIHLNLESSDSEIINLLTNIIKKNSQDFKARIIKELWKIIISNDISDEYEANLMRRICGLIYFSDKLSGEIKMSLILERKKI